MAGPRARWAAALGCLLALGLAVGAADHAPQLPATEEQKAASSAAELLQAINRTQGHDRSVTITLLGPRRHHRARPPQPPPAACLRAACTSAAIRSQP